VLDTLKRECVRASFFLLGRNALVHQELARRELSEGHTVGHHTFSHPLLNRMPVAAAVAEIDREFAAVNTCRLRQLQRGAEDAVLPLPGFCLEPALACCRRSCARSRIAIIGSCTWSRAPHQASCVSER
jgi:hypothetical protein